MRKITGNLYMTLDGRGEFPKYPAPISPRVIRKNRTSSSGRC
jgi:hypothetical protein